MNDTQIKTAKDTTKLFGFWMYLMTDFVLFASLFAVYAVLRANTFGGPSGHDLFNGNFVLLETVILLTSSFTAGLSLIGARDGKKNTVLFWLVVSGVLGASFVALEFSEFAKLIAAGNGPQLSGFLSSYFVLVGTHGLHIIVGLLWVVSLIFAIVRKGLTRGNMRKLIMWSMFWHFLDIVWIFIFTIVYLLSLR